MVLIFADEPIRDGIYTGARIRGVKSAEVARGLLSDFVPDCMIIHLFLVGWVMYFFVRFLCRFYLTNTHAPKEVEFSTNKAPVRIWHCPFFNHIQRAKI